MPVHDAEIKILQEELKQFRQEKEKIKNVIGSIGGKALKKSDKLLNICFLLTVSILFIIDTLRHILKINIPLPPLFSIEIGLLLVSIKIIWMINKQMKVEHFQFWILNSIEYRINTLSKQLTEIKGAIANLDKYKTFNTNTKQNKDIS